MSEKPSKNSPMLFAYRILQGALIGLGAVLPGISGGVLSVIFGIYKPIMELLSNPFKNFKTHVPPTDPGIYRRCDRISRDCQSAGLFPEQISGSVRVSLCRSDHRMLPSLFREAGEKGVTKGSYLSLVICMIVIFSLLTGLNAASVEIEPNFISYLFCGFCLALSVIAPGMSFSTLLMPLGLYTPFVDGIGHLDFQVMIPGGIGAVVTVICLAKAINALFEHFYSLAFHGIVGIVIAATVMIIPFFQLYCFRKRMHHQHHLPCGRCNRSPSSG